MPGDPCHPRSHRRRQDRRASPEHLSGAVPARQWEPPTSQLVVGVGELFAVAEVLRSAGLGAGDAPRCPPQPAAIRVSDTIKAAIAMAARMHRPKAGRRDRNLMA